MPIAELDVILVASGGTRTRGRIVVEAPVVVDEVESQCAVTLEGIDRTPFRASGTDTLQALTLAVRYAGSRLEDFLWEGGQILRAADETPLELAPYFGPLVRPGAAFSKEEFRWARPDVMCLAGGTGLLSTTLDHLEWHRQWFERHGYARLTLDGSAGALDLRRQVGELCRWEEQFGYRLEEGTGSLDALNDGFDFEVPSTGGLVLEILRPEVALQEDERWFTGLLEIASEVSRRHLAQGRRFITLLGLEEHSPLSGKPLGQSVVPCPHRPDRAADRS